jgi:hypothetical protein
MESESNQSVILKEIEIVRNKFSQLEELLIKLWQDPSESLPVNLTTIPYLDWGKEHIRRLVDNIALDSNLSSTASRLENRYDEIVLATKESGKKRLLLLLKGVRSLLRYLSDIDIRIKSAGESPSENTDNKPSLARAERLAYDSYDYAISQNSTLSEATDDEVYNWLKDHGTPEGYELPTNCDTWKRQVRAGRKYHSTQKKTPRAGRTGRSIIHKGEV